MANSIYEVLQRMLSVERNKVFRFSPIPALISENEKVEAYYSDELRIIWQSSIRDWSIYSKREEV